MRALAADHVDLGEPGELVLANRVLDHLLRRVRIGVGLFVRDRKGAELALHAADVGLVQVQVLDEVDAVVAATHAPSARMSSLSINVTPSSKSSRSPPSTLSRMGASMSVRSRRAINAPDPRRHR